MTFSGVDASGGGEFLPQHPKTGEFYSLKGRMLTPPELPYMESTVHMNQRPQSQSSMGELWNQCVIVNTGETGAGGVLAK